MLGPTALGFRHRDDVGEITALLGASASTSTSSRRSARRRADLARLGEADFNVVLYPEIAATAAQVAGAHVRPAGDEDRSRSASARRAISSPKSPRSPASTPTPLLAATTARSTWYSRSVDSTYLHRQARLRLRRRDARRSPRRASPARNSASRSCGLGTYSREFARDVREAAKTLRRRGADHRRLPRGRGEGRRRCSPNWCSARRWSATSPSGCGVPCAVISAPVHVQDFPARYSPQMGFEGANVIFDTWVHPLMMGLEEHLLGMFRGDFEFHADAAPSHLGIACAESEEPARRRSSSRLPSRRSRSPHARSRRLGSRRREASSTRSRSSCAARPAQHRALRERPRHAGDHGRDPL